MLSAIGAGESRLSGFLHGEDCLATLAALRALGVGIDTSPDGDVTVCGAGMHGLQSPAHPLDFGNSGTAMRLMAGLLCAQQFDSVLIGDDSLMRRPMDRVAVPLRQMGAAIETSLGMPPLRISGGRVLRPIDYALPVASAQVKSAILLAGLYAEGATRTVCPGVTRDHTERMLSGLGAAIDIEADEFSVVVHGPATLRSMDWQIPGDFSSAAFFIVAAVLAADPEAQIVNVGLNPTRTGLIHILREMGAQIEVQNERIVGGEPVGDLRVRRSDLQGIDVPAAHIASAIDEFPVLFVAAALARGTSRLRGAEELRHKETDRLAVMAEALSRVGVTVEEHRDGIDITGGAIGGGTVDSRGDHRIAMAMAVAALRASEPIDIGNTAQVATSFPGFSQTAALAGMRLSEIEGRS
jgi:3-phosphoshikimate 1-carboxyvinyltransferase